MIIYKNWGSENIIETNPMYTVKILTILKGERFSLQFHEKKHETFYILSGILKFTYGTNKDSLESKLVYPGESFVIPPFFIHRMEGIVDSTFLEASTSELTDVIRLEDDYGRV